MKLNRCLPDARKSRYIMPRMAKLTQLSKQVFNMITWQRLLIFTLISGVVWFGVILVLAMQIEDVGQTDEAQPADVIIVLGSGLRRDGRPGDALYRRSLWGARLYEQGYAETVLCTGGIGDGQRRSEASACREVLINNGVPAAAITLEEQSASTEENALYAHEIMRSMGWVDALLVTDSFHMLRASWIFDAEGITHYRSPAPREWVRDYFYNRHFTREIVALHWQAFKETLNLPVTRVEL